MPAFDDILNRLESDRKEVVFPTVERLVKPAMIPLPRSVKEGLIGVVEDCGLHDSNAPLWAITVLGERQAKDAISALFGVFLVDEADFWHEAAEYALKKIARKHPDAVFQELKDWMEPIVSELESLDPFSPERQAASIKYSGRIYAYGALEPLVPREDAKQYVISLIERDPDMNDCLAPLLLHWPIGKEANSLLRRQLEIADLRAGDNPYLRIGCNDLKWSLIHLARGETGARYRAFRDPLDDKPWRERWEWIFKQKSPHEKSKGDQEEVRTADGAETKEAESAVESQTQDSETDTTDEAQEDVEHDNELFEQFELPPFNIEEYLSLRVRTPLEQKVQDMLEYYGIAGRWSVETVQTKMSRARVPSEVQQTIFDAVDFKDLEEARTFSKLFGDLWNATPREEFNGLTPNEKVLTSPFRSVSHDATRVKIGRNDPCPCGAKKDDGSPKKYKHCCGK